MAINMMVLLSKMFLVDLFFSGLQEDIRGEVELFSPDKLTQAVRLSGRAESKLTSQKPNQSATIHLTLCFAFFQPNLT